MVRRFLLILAFLTLLSLLAGAQQTPQIPSHQWRAIASLPPGSQLLVRQVDSRILQPCTLAWIDNTTLACDIFVPAVGPRRVVFPIASVASVTQQASPNDTHSDADPVALFFGVGLGRTLGGLPPATSLFVMASPAASSHPSRAVVWVYSQTRPSAQSRCLHPRCTFRSPPRDSQPTAVTFSSPKQSMRTL